MRRWRVEWYSTLDGEHIDQEAIGLEVRRFFTQWGARLYIRSMPESSMLRGEIERV